MRASLRAFAVVAVFLLALAPAGAFAISAAGPGLAPAGMPAAQENTNPDTNLGYLFAIYIITWAGFFAYIFIVSRRQRSLEREVENLRKLLVERQGSEQG